MVIAGNGGADHQVAFGSVKVACLALFWLGYANLFWNMSLPDMSEHTEWVMSTLNLLLQNVSLKREAMPPEHDKLIKNKNTRINFDRYAALEAAV